MKTIKDFDKKICRRELEYYNSYRRATLPAKLLIGFLFLLMAALFGLFIYGWSYIILVLITQAGGKL
jgi:hypothetical protein